jgi:hypothetical protein
MKLILALAGLLISTTGFSANPAGMYELDLAYTVNGDTVSTQLVGLENAPMQFKHTGEVGERTVRVVLSETAGRAVQTDFNLGYTGVDGQRTLRFKPRIIAREGEKATMTLKSDPEDVEITVTAVARRAN